MIVLSKHECKTEVSGGTKAPTSARYVWHFLFALPLGGATKVLRVYGGKRRPDINWEAPEETA